MWSNQIIVLTVLTGLVKISRPYNMEPITRSPVTETPSVLDSEREILFEFLSHQNPTLQIIPGKLSLGDVVDLCEAVKRDDNTIVEVNEGKLYYYIPIKPKNGGSFPTFRIPCYGWKRNACGGIPKPPFDYRCSYWTPFFHYAGAECRNKGAVSGSYRKKRMTRPWESMTVNGFEAVSLCATAGLLEAQFDELSRDSELKSIALPSNEASSLRCINWILSPEGGWFQEQLDKATCNLLNAKRPSSYIDNEINLEQGTIVEDVFSDLVKCESNGKNIQCIFSRKFGIKY